MPKKSQYFYLWGTVFGFLLNAVLPLIPAKADLILPAPGRLIGLSHPFAPAMIKGVLLHPENPFKFDFLVDSGASHLKGGALRSESMRLIKYFLAALTIPEEEMWVNLSPYEKDRMIPKSLAETAMGRDLLAQDYILKQLTASLTYPEKDLGKKFWDKVYAQAQAKYGRADIAVNTFNKVWIVPEKARIYERDGGAFVTESRLKVMLEEDYLALTKNTVIPAHAGIHSVSSQVAREIIIPALEKEVNEGSHFANLRQIYQAMILAAWYKIRLKESILGKLYVDQDKTRGVALNDKHANEKIYQQYLQAFKKGVYNYIKEDGPPASRQNTARKYVSGGFMAGAALKQAVLAGLGKGEAAMLSPIGDLTLVQVSTRNISARAVADEAMISHPDYIDTFYQVDSYDPPVLRIDRVFNLPLTEEENADVIRQVQNDPNAKAALLTREAINRGLRHLTEVMGQDMGIIPEGYLGQETAFSPNIWLILDDFLPHPLTEALRKLRGWTANVRAAGFFRVKIHDAENDRDLYLLLIEKNKNGFILKPLGGGYKFTGEEGKAQYTAAGISMKPFDKDPLEIRQEMPQTQLPAFIDLFNKDIGHNTAYDELFEEWVQEARLSSNVPRSWQRNGQKGSVPDPAMFTKGGIDLNSHGLDLQIKRDNKGLPLPVQLQDLGRIKIDGLYPVIVSMTPVDSSQFAKVLTKQLQ